MIFFKITDVCGTVTFATPDHMAYISSAPADRIDIPDFGLGYVEAAKLEICRFDNNGVTTTLVWEAPEPLADTPIGQQTSEEIAAEFGIDLEDFHPDYAPEPPVQPGSVLFGKMTELEDLMREMRETAEGAQWEKLSRQTEDARAMLETIDQCAEQIITTRQ